MSEENKALVRGFYDDINRGDMDVFEAKLANNVVEHETFPGVPPTKEGVGMLFEQLRKAFSGFRMNVEAIAAEGEMVVVRGTMTGTHDETRETAPRKGYGRATKSYVGFWRPHPSNHFDSRHGADV